MRLCFLYFYVDINQIGSLSSDVFKRSRSIGSWLFAHLSRYFEQVFGQIVSKWVKTHKHTNLVASRQIKKEKSSLRGDVPRSKRLLFKLSNITPNTLLHFGNSSYNLLHSFCSERLGFWKGRKVDVCKKCDQEGEQKEKGPSGGGVSHAPPLPLRMWLWEF